MLERVIGAARQDAGTYEEVKNDNEAMMRAVLVVAVAAIAAIVIGALLTAGPVFWLWVIISGIVLVRVAWVIWSDSVWIVGTKLMPSPGTQADWKQVFQRLGFSQGPGVVAVFSFIPYIGWLFTLVATIWRIVTTVYAIRVVSGYDGIGRAVVVFIVSAIPVAIITVIIWVIIYNVAAPVGYDWTTS